MLDNDWISLFEEASQKFDLLGFMVRDPRDITLPNVSAEVLIQDPITGEKMLTEPDTIKKAYLKAARNFHPDKHSGLPDPSMKDKLTSLFTLLNRAYDTLSNETEKEKYDSILLKSE